MTRQRAGTTKQRRDQTNAECFAPQESSQAAAGTVAGLFVNLVEPSVPFFQRQFDLELMTVTFPTKAASILFFQRLQQRESNINRLEVFGLRVRDIARERADGAATGGAQSDLRSSGESCGIHPASQPIATDST